MEEKNRIWDNQFNYGLLSRAFHWLMALLFLWQFISVVLRVSAKETAVAGFFWSTHFTVGFTLFLLVLLRGAWGLLNLRNRPSAAGMAGKLAHLGHALLYGLMFAVPALALLRAYGRGGGFSYLGFPVFERTGETNDMLTSLGNAFHGLSGWILFALIAGHVTMALFHHFVVRDNTLRAMVGRGVAR